MAHRFLAVLIFSAIFYSDLRTARRAVASSALVERDELAAFLPAIAADILGARAI
jgi:hypothetical protein